MNYSFYKKHLISKLNETADYRNEVWENLCILPAGESMSCTGKYGVEYEFLKNQNWDGDLHSYSNQIQIAAIYNNKHIASVYKEAWISHPSHFNLDQILDGYEPMVGAISGKASSCVIEELKALGKDFSYDPDKVFERMLEKSGYALELMENPDGSANELFALVSLDYDDYRVDKGRYAPDAAEEMFKALQDRFEIFALDKLAEEAVERELFEGAYDYTATDWTEVFAKYDNADSLDISESKMYRFVQKFREEFEMCDLVKNRLSDVNLQRVYDNMFDYQYTEQNKNHNKEKGDVKYER